MTTINIKTNIPKLNEVVNYLVAYIIDNTKGPGEAIWLCKMLLESITIVALDQGATKEMLDGLTIQVRGVRKEKLD